MILFGIRKEKDGQLGDIGHCNLMTLYPAPLALTLITSEVCGFLTGMLRIQSKAPLVEEN